MKATYKLIARYKTTTNDESVIDAFATRIDLEAFEGISISVNYEVATITGTEFLGVYLEVIVLADEETFIPAFPDYCVVYGHEFYLDIDYCDVEVIR